MLRVIQLAADGGKLLVERVVHARVKGQKRGTVCRSSAQRRGRGRGGTAGCAVENHPCLVSFVSCSQCEAIFFMTNIFSQMRAVCHVRV